MLEESDESVRVAAAIIKKDNRFLLCQRGINRRYGLKWEFPGGKTYPGEPLAECLSRELEEELELEPTVFKELVTLRTTYSDGGNFLISFFLVTKYGGELKNNVFEKIEWVQFDEIEKYDLLDGTRPVLRYLLPYK